MPARKVSRIAPNPASQLTQSVSCKCSRLPAMAPTMISVRATEIVSQTDSTEAASARPIHNAAISQTFSTRASFTTEMRAPEFPPSLWPTLADAARKAAGRALPGAGLGAMAFRPCAPGVAAQLLVEFPAEDGEP